MNYGLLKEMYAMEEDYWWHRGKRANVLFQIKRFARNKDLKILDVGCGTGYLLKELQNEVINAYGIDISIQSLAFCKKRGIKNLKHWDIEKNPYPQITFDVVLALDVIEHIQDDNKAMKNIAKSLNKDGIVIFASPAFPFLWSYWDELAGHFRRYDKKSLVKLFEDSGFKIEFISYTNVLIFLPVVAIRIIKQKLGIKKLNDNTSDFVKVPILINVTLYLILRFEAFVSNFVSLPFGLSFIAVGRKVKLEKKSQR